MQISGNKLKQIIQEEVTRFLKETDSLKRQAAPHLSILKYYSRFLKDLNVKDLDDQRLAMANNLKAFIDKQKTQEFLVSSMRVDPKVLMTAIKPIYMMNRLGGANSEAVAIMLSRAKDALMDVIGDVEDAYFENSQDKEEPSGAPRDTEQDQVSTRAITNKKSSARKRRAAGAGAYSLREDDTMPDDPPIPMEEPVKPLEATGLIEQVADAMEMIQNKKQNMIDAGPPETAQEVEASINNLSAAFSTFQAVLAQHIHTAENGFSDPQADMEAPISERDEGDLPKLAPEDRAIRRHEMRKAVKQRGEERKALLKKKEEKDGNE